MRGSATITTVRLKTMWNYLLNYGPVKWPVLTWRFELQCTQTTEVLYAVRMLLWNYCSSECCVIFTPGSRRKWHFFRLPEPKRQFVVVFVTDFGKIFISSSLPSFFATNISFQFARFFRCFLNLLNRRLYRFWWHQSSKTWEQTSHPPIWECM